MNWNGQRFSELEKLSTLKKRKERGAVWNTTKIPSSNPIKIDKRHVLESSLFIFF